MILLVIRRLREIRVAVAHIFKHRHWISEDEDGELFCRLCKRYFRLSHPSNRATEALP